MNIAILQTARAGSKSVPDKNVMKFNETPLFLHNILHAQKSKFKIPIYLSTDIPNLEELSKKHNFRIIQRPKNLSNSQASHHEVMIHGLKTIEKIQNKKIDILIVILGNTISAWPEDIDKAVEILKDQPDVDSAITVGKYNMFNPVRALSISDDGGLDRIVKKNVLNANITNSNINDKEVIGDVYYLNGSLLAMRRSSILGSNDKLPFTWLGDKIIPIIQKSICKEIDAEWQINIIDQISKDYSTGRQ